ncbi:MAG: ComEC family competence protein [Crocinitomicaceae bacterium]|nr:ComEC family competence protein [Crocinitomicaceae bacterium]
MKILTNSSLLFWLISFILGIVFFINDSYYLIFILSIVSIVIGFLPIQKINNLRFYFLLAPLFCISGYLLTDNYFPYENEILTMEDNYYIGTILEQSTKDKVWNSVIVQLNSEKVNESWVTTNEKVLLIVENSDVLTTKNDLILFETKFNKIELKNNPGEFNAKNFWISKGVRYQGFVGADQVKLLQHKGLNWFESVLQNTRDYSSKLLDKWIGVNESPLIKAILLGDKSDLDSETKRVFTNTGTMHMLAVSGLHVGVIVVILDLIFKFLFFFRARNVVSVLMLLLLWFYAFLTGFSASVVRAVVMFSVLILARFLHRDYQPINSLSIAAFIILLASPLTIFDIGFQLSFLAMLGIFTFYPLIEQLIVPPNSFLTTVWQGTAIGLAAQIFTVPASLYYFGQFPNYFFLSNLGVMLFSGIMLGFAIAILALGKISFVAIPIGWLLSISCIVFVQFILLIEAIPGAVAKGFYTSIWWVVLAYFIVLVSLFLFEKKKWFFIASCVLPLIIWAQFVRFQNLNKKEWLVFNTLYPTILVNNAGQQICLYAGNEKGKKNAVRLVQDYQKFHPGQIDYIPLSEGIYTVDRILPTTSLLIDVTKELITFQYNDKRYLYVTNSNFDKNTIPKYTKVISQHLKTNVSNFYDLSTKAFRENLE